MDMLRCGDYHPEVAEVRQLLLRAKRLEQDAYVIDPLPTSSRIVASDQSPFLSNNLQALPAYFDKDLDAMLREFQQKRGLLVDGIVGPATYRVLREATYRLGSRTLAYMLSAPLYGDDVVTLQQKLQELGFYFGRVDGFFGSKTHSCLLQFQQEIGLHSDGICGPNTLQALAQLSTRASGGSPHRISEEEIVRRSGPQLTGKRIVLDPGRGGNSSGTDIFTDDGIMSESELLWDIANRLEGRMAVTGMETLLTRSRLDNPSVIERANFANDFGANITIALRCDNNANKQANGIASFYFGNSHGYVSPIGEKLAGFIQREIIARTTLRDCHSHGRTWDLLRLTNMPTVQIDLGYLSNESDCRFIANQRHRDTICEAILVAVRRLYLLDQDDQPTGTYTFAHLMSEVYADEQL